MRVLTSEISRAAHLLPDGTHVVYDGRAVPQLVIRLPRDDDGLSPLQYAALLRLRRVLDNHPANRRVR